MNKIVICAIKKHIPNLVFLLIHIYITNMQDHDYISHKISQIKAIAYHKIKDGVLETIPYTNVLLNEKSARVAFTFSIDYR